MIASFLAGAAASIPYKTCVTTDHAHISEVDATPWPPVHGKTVTLNVTGTPDISVASGTIKVDVTAYGIPVPGTPSFDICKDLGLTCPIPAGKAFKAAVSYGINSKVPSGISVTIKLLVEDGSGTEIGCVELDTKIGSSMFAAVENELSSLNPFASRKLTAEKPVEEAKGDAKAAAKPLAKAPDLKSPAPASLVKLLEANSGRSEAENKQLLVATYGEQPEWRSLWGAWQLQHKKEGSYSSAAEEGRRFAAFKQSINRLDALKAAGKPAVADQHLDKSADEMKSFAHFA